MPDEERPTTDQTSVADGSPTRRPRTARRPQRATVAHPRTLAARSGHLPGALRTPLTDDFGRQTPLGDVYLRSLMRTQLRLGLAVVGVLVAVLAGLPFLFVAVPWLRDAHALGVPLPWLVIGVAVHPVLLLLALVYLRQARRNERDFADLVERS